MLDTETSRRLQLPNGVSGVIVTRVDPLSSSHDAGMQRDQIVMEINRRPINSTEAYNRVARSARPGDVLAIYVYTPATDQRSTRAVRVDAGRQVANAIPGAQWLELPGTAHWWWLGETAPIIDAIKAFAKRFANVVAT